MDSGSKALPQPMRPSGFAGRIFGFVMETVAAPNYRWVVAELKPLKPKTYLEIGFGTGRLAGMIAAKLRPTLIAGVDPSKLMHDKASRRLKRYAKRTTIDLRSGDDTTLDWPDRSFDAIVASHSFQFWSDPAATLARVRMLLATGGRFVIVLRRHGNRAPAWLPNPISKSGDELVGLKAALTRAGLQILRDEKLETGSHGLVAAANHG